MTSAELDDLVATRPYPRRIGPEGSYIVKLVTPTDPKRLGIMYLLTSFSFFFVGGSMALLLCAELGRPGLQFLSNERCNPLFTMYATIMLLFATPMCSGSRTMLCRCRSESPMWRSRGRTRWLTGCICSVG